MTLDELAIETLVRAYRTELNVPVESWFQTWPSDSIFLLGCQTCGVGHFDPSLPGDSSFYGLLRDLYPESRWEFAEASSMIDGGEIADLGCGPGHFLARVQGATRRVGNDLNPDLASDLADLGIEPLIGALTEMTEHFDQEFDVVTSFHLLEHLDRPSDLFDTARAILRPRGRLFVSVPNADRLIVDTAIGPLDWPPHHLTRWTPEPLRRAGEASGFSMEALRYEPTHACYRRLRHLPGPVAVPVAGALAYARGGHINWSSLYRHRGWLRSGHAILGVFRRN